MSATVISLLTLHFPTHLESIFLLSFCFITQGFLLGGCFLRQSFWNFIHLASFSLPQDTDIIFSDVLSPGLRLCCPNSIYCSQVSWWFWSSGFNQFFKFLQSNWVLLFSISNRSFSFFGDICWTLVARDRGSIFRWNIASPLRTSRPDLSVLATWWTTLKTQHKKKGNKQGNKQGKQYQWYKLLLGYD